MPLFFKVCLPEEIIETGSFTMIGRFIQEFYIPHLQQNVLLSFKHWSKLSLVDEYSKQTRRDRKIITFCTVTADYKQHVRVTLQMILKINQMIFVFGGFELKRGYYHCLLEYIVFKFCDCFLTVMPLTKCLQDSSKSDFCNCFNVQK